MLPLFFHSLDFSVKPKKRMKCFTPPNFSGVVIKLGSSLSISGQWRGDCSKLYIHLPSFQDQFLFRNPIKIFAERHWFPKFPFTHRTGQFGFIVWLLKYSFQQEECLSLQQQGTARIRFLLLATKREDILQQSNRVGCETLDAVQV